MIRFSQRFEKSRLLLWVALTVLVTALLGVLAFLARSYQDSEDKIKLEQAASLISSDIHSGLHRNIQDLQTLSVLNAKQNSYSWLEDFIARHREIFSAELRNLSFHSVKTVNTPYIPRDSETLSRVETIENVRMACSNAIRYGEAGYAPSYFWPLAKGKGEELMEMCFPAQLNDGEKGYLIVSYRLPEVLTEMVRRELQEKHTIYLTDPDGARLSILGKPRGSFKALQTTQPLELPGASYLLRVDQLRQSRGWFPSVLSATVALLAMSLLAVLMLLAKDIRKRQKAETDLGDSMAFRQAMENSLVTALRAQDLDGKITYVNPAFCALVGMTESELIGTGKPAPYWPPEIVAEHEYRRALRVADPNSPSMGYETAYVRPDGTRVPVRIFEAPLLDQTGSQTGWMSSIVDLSEQRRMEEVTRTSQERLQATARLAMAGEMASLISHELNQPLAAISSYANGSLNLLDTSSDVTGESIAEIKHAMQKMANEATRAGLVIKSVADLVRRRDGARELTQVQSLFDAITPLLRLRAQRDGIHLRFKVEEGCPPVWCDRTMIEQVLLNLGRNGIQAMPAGQPTAASGLRSLELMARTLRDKNVDGRVWVELSVKDHGIGLSEEAKKQMFTPFFTTKAEGMGLGLSLCRTVVEQHGGQLTYTEAKPTGMVFAFNLLTSS